LVAASPIRQRFLLSSIQLWLGGMEWCDETDWFCYP
jgi:hypothetical protein